MAPASKAVEVRRPAPGVASGRATATPVGGIRRLVPAIGPASIEAAVCDRLEGLVSEAPTLPVDPSGRVVIISDLHAGDGGRRDDFLHNAPLVHDVLEKHYLDGGYKLVLNGDVEELQNFSMPTVLGAWPKLFELFRAFEDRGALTKILGNHDEDLAHYRGPYPLDGPRHWAMKLLMGGEQLLVFHGHQASNFYQFFYKPCAKFMRYVASPLGFKNISVSQDDTRRIKLERRVYEFARRTGLLTVIGHTHRPLFESLSKADSVKYQIERLCREYGRAAAWKKQAIGWEIKRLKEELHSALARKEGDGSLASVYDQDLVVPCLFNSGCAIGKRGITAIEIVNGNISLVHWLGGDQHPDRFDTDDSHPKRLGDTPYYRVVLRRESLEYVFARIRLLS